MKAKHNDHYFMCLPHHLEYGIIDFPDIDVVIADSEVYDEEYIFSSRKVGTRQFSADHMATFGDA